MKIFRLAAALAFLLACAPAFAQQTAIHSVPIGKGVGNTGFNAAVPGTAGKPLVSQGATSDPAFGNIANSGFAAGAANTYKGSLDGSTVSDIAFPNCQSVSTALRYVPGTGPACGSVIVQTGFDMPVNLGLSVPAPSGGALVINLTQANGSAPSSTNPVLVPFRSTTLTTGAVSWTTISAPQSVTIPSGATLGTSNNIPFRVWIFEDYNGGTPELGVATCSNSTTIFPCARWESTLVTSATIGGSSNSGGVLYATAGVTLDAVRIVGYCDFSAGLATAGSWSSACTTLQPFGPGVHKPGEYTGNMAYAASSTPTTGSGTTLTATVPTISITPTATPNLIQVDAKGVLTQGAASGSAPALAQVYRAAGSSAACTTAVGATGGFDVGSAAAFASVNPGGVDAPGTPLAQQTYTVCIKEISTGNPVYCSSAVVTQTCTLQAQEIMGRREDDPVNDDLTFGMTG